MCGFIQVIPGSPGNPGLRLEKAGAAEVSAFSPGVRGAPRWRGCEGSRVCGEGSHCAFSEGARLCWEGSSGGVGGYFSGVQGCCHVQWRLLPGPWGRSVWTPRVVP